VAIAANWFLDAGETRAHLARRESRGTSRRAFAAEAGVRVWLQAPPPRSTCSEAVGRFAHIVKCPRILRPVN
jgi:hypothetical protein